MNKKIIRKEIVYQDYSDCDSGLPSHWCAIVHYEGDDFPIYIYAETEEELRQELKGGAK
jgi:NADH:ubiquinone oxidoreductase subunit